MPSPVGHAVAGAIIALASDRPAAAGEWARLKSRSPFAAIPWMLVLVCAVLAALPDIDYIYPPSHRRATHSIGATIIVMLVVAAVTRWTTGRISWRIAAVCGLAYFSHIFMDWLGEDPTPTPGVLALWPLSDRLFISGWELFRSTRRLEPFAPAQIAHNMRTLVQEMAILGPILLWVLWRRAKTRA